jgi:hypothetical protein
VSISLAGARPLGAAVVADGHVLLVDGEHGWDLPGGLAGLSESDVDAAIRLLREETGIELVRQLDAVVYAGPADDARIAATLQGDNHADGVPAGLSARGGRSGARRMVPGAQPERAVRSAPRGWRGG